MISFQTQLPHGFPYADRRSDYGGSIGGGPGNRIHEHDPIALHQVLQNAVDDGQNTGMDENVGFMSDLPLLKSKYTYIYMYIVYSVVNESPNLKQITKLAPSSIFFTIMFR